MRKDVFGIINFLILKKKKQKIVKSTFNEYCYEQKFYEVSFIIIVWLNKKIPKFNKLVLQADKNSKYLS